MSDSDHGHGWLWFFLILIALNQCDIEADVEELQAKVGIEQEESEE